MTRPRARWLRSQILELIGLLYVTQAIVGAVVGFTVPWLHYFGWL